MPAPLEERSPDGGIRSSYIRVLIVWIVTLAALYAFQESFL